jgi:putative PIN family toxin of toxin-antitoxin system
LPNKHRLIVCLDANVIVSAFAYGGLPLIILARLYDLDYFHVTGPNILEEVRRTLTHKLHQDENEVNDLLNSITSASSLVVPLGKIKALHHHGDNKVLEVAIAGSCDVLVTGDKRHLLPLNPFQGVVIESPSHFLNRLNTLRGS